VRTEWLPFAWRTAQRLIRERDHDVLISSHEPGVDLLLGLRAQRVWKKPWIADLADPLITPYTPRWRTRWDQSLEQRVCERSDNILVTAETAATELSRRHAIPISRFVLIRQGFDHRQADSGVAPPPPWPSEKMVFLFTGSLYPRFRDPSALIEASKTLPPDVQLVFIGDTGRFEQALAAQHPRALVLGKQPHDQCLAWQRQADILIDIGNQQDDQIPGKVYEYLGAGRPILHIAASATDPVGAMIADRRRGISVLGDPHRIGEAMSRLHRQWTLNALDRTFDLSADAVQAYSWANNARRLERVVSELHGDRTGEQRL
jgi:glycosyltransferase involved in cell wall biosynthesis